MRESIEEGAMSAQAMGSRCPWRNCPLTGCEHAVRRACKIVGKWGRVGVNEASQGHIQGTDRPPEVSCLYSVMSRLSAVGFPDERDAIADNGTGRRGIVGDVGEPCNLWRAGQLSAEGPVRLEKV
jgi:hypothetical protein